MARGRQIVKKLEVEEITLKVAAEDFYSHNAVKGLSVAAQKAYKNYVDCFMRWCGEDTVVADISGRTIEEYLLVRKEMGNKPVSLATTAKHLRRFIYFCASRNYLIKFEVTIPKFEVELKEPYTDEEMKLLLAKPKSNSWIELRAWAMVNYFFSTGQRLSTVLNIKVCHLDFINSRVKLEWNKDKRQKYMPLSTALVRVLREYIDVSDLAEEDYLFPEYEGGQLKVRSAEDAIADYNRKRGVEKTSIHLFRHTFAKNYIMNGGNPVKLQKLLNHKTMDMTMRYINLYGDDISADLDLFNPLDNFKRSNYTPTKRRKLAAI